MNGIKYLLDTNFILGILKSNSLVLAELSSRRLLAGECSYSAITRMELLGFQSITREEELLIRQRLERLTYLPLTRDIEDVVIELASRVRSNCQTRSLPQPPCVLAPNY